MLRISRNEERLLAEMLNTSDPWRVAGHARVDFPQHVKTLKGLVRKGLISLSPTGVLLTEKGMRLVREMMLLPAEEITGRVETATPGFVEVMRRRPRTTLRHDQGYMTMNSVFRRASLIARMGDARGKRLAVLGDDELVSIAVALAFEPRQVLVLDTDECLVDFIGETAARLDLPVTAACWDPRAPLPTPHAGRFDAFVTDPPETLEALKAYLARGMCALEGGPGRAGYLGLSSIEASYAKWGALEAWLLKEYPVAITHILPGYAYYENWPDLAGQTARYGLESLERAPRSAWFNSALVRLESLEAFAPRQARRIRALAREDGESCGGTGRGTGKGRARRSKAAKRPGA